MKESPLNIRTNEDPTLVVLTDKEKQAAQKAYNDFRFAGAELLKQMQEGTLNVGYKTTLGSLLESYTVELNKQFGYKGKLQEEQEERFADIRRLNMENHELRKQLGEKVSNEDVREKLKNLTESVGAWWRSVGTGHVSESSYGSRGNFHGKLTGMLFNDDNRPAMEAYGIRFTDELGHCHMIDCDGSRDGVLRLLQEKYPSAFIVGIEVYGGRRSEEFTIRDIKFMIDDLNEIQ